MVNKPTVQTPPERVYGQLPSSNSSLTIDVSIKDTDVFKDLTDLVVRMFKDERMPQSLRDDVYGWVQELHANASLEQYYVKEQIVILCESVSLGKFYWTHIRHKYNPDAKVRFISKGCTPPDGLAPDKVVLVKGYQESNGYPTTWFKHNGELSQVIDETGER